MGRQIYLLPIIILVFICEQTWQYKLVCYFSNQSQYELVTRFRFFAEDIPACRCTHIHFAYAEINNADLAPTEFNDDTPGGSYSMVVDMKSVNPGLKVLLSVGGPQQSSAPFLKMLSSTDSILQFATNAVAYLRKHSFDGIDIAWEFPGNSLPSPDLYTQLIRELRTAFNNEAVSQGNDRLLLAVTLASTKTTIDASYDIQGIEPYIDYANILSYNYHNHCENTTGLNAPLYSSQEERIIGEGGEQLNQNWTVNYYIDLGLPPEKINVGIPTFGVKFSLEHEANKGVGSPTHIPLNCQPDDDRIPYYQICDGLNAHDPSRRWVNAYDNEQEAPYASYGKEWITYESQRSVRTKAEFIMNNSLGGAMIWSLDRDDFSNSCEKGEFPLLSAIQDTLGSTVKLCDAPLTPGPTQQTTLSQATTALTISASTTTTQSTTTTTTQPTTTTTTQPTNTTTPATSTAPTRASTGPQDYTSRCEKISDVRDCLGYISPVTTTSVTAITTTRTTDFVSSLTTLSSVTKTTSPVTTVTNVPMRNSSEVQDFEQLCQNPGQLLPVNVDCRKFVQCVFTSPGNYIPFMQDCPEPTYFSIDTLRCEKISEVRDCPGYIPSRTATSMTPVTKTKSTSSVTSVPATATTTIPPSATIDTPAIPTATAATVPDTTSTNGSQVITDTPTIHTATRRTKADATTTTPSQITTDFPTTPTATTTTAADITTTTTSQVTTDTLVTTTPDPCSPTNYRMVCYVTNRDYFPPLYHPDIDVKLCTHLIYAFASLIENNVSVETTADTQVYHEVLALRSRNPNLKVLISIGGWNHLQAPFKDLVSSDTSIDQFAQAAISFLRAETFDGLDLAWMFPSESQVLFVQDRFTALLQGLHKAFTEEAMSSSKSRLLLTVATGAKKEVIDGSYSIPDLHRYADFVNVLTFDYHLRCAIRTGMNAPLYAGTGELTRLNQNWTVNYYLDNGLPREKLVMGIPVYGRQFRLANLMNNGPGQLTVGVEATCRRNSGVTTYLSICSLLSTFQTAWDNVRRVPFAYNTKQVWLTYENERSVIEKANFIKSEDLGGAVVWSLNEDDFLGSCGVQTYPLVNAIRCTLSESGPSSGATIKSTSATTKSTGPTASSTGPTINSAGSTSSPTGTATKSTLSTGTTTTSTRSTLPATNPPCNGPPRNPNEPQNFTALCVNNTDLLPYNPDCTRFVQCEPDGWVIKNCPACLYFNPGNSVCDFPGNVEDCAAQQTTIFPGSSTKSPGSTTKSTLSTGTTTTFTGSTLPTTTPACNRPPRNPNEPQNFTALCMNDTDLLPYNPDCTRFVQCEPDGWVIKNCPACLYFNPGNSVCDSPGNVTDCAGQQTTIFPGSSTKSPGSTTKSTLSTGTTTTFTGSTLPTTTPACNRPPRNPNEPQNFTALCMNDTDLLPYNPDCTRFVQCEPDGWVIKNCPACLYFNPGNSVCDSPGNVTDCAGQQTTIFPGSSTKSPGSTTKSTRSTGTTTTFTGSTLPTTTPACNRPPRNPNEPQNFTALCMNDTDLLPYNPDCTRFVQCEPDGWVIKNCPACLYFNPGNSVCDSPGNVTDCAGQQTTIFPGSSTKSPGSTTKSTLSTGTTTTFTGFTLPTTTPACNRPPRNPNEPQNFTALCMNDTDLLPYNPDCTRFVQCEPDGWVIKNCPACLYFNPGNSVCDSPGNVTDCAGQQTTIIPGSSTKSPGSTTKSTLSTGTTTTFTGSTLPTTTPACNRPPRNPNEPQNFTALCMNDTDLLPYNPDCTRFVQCEPDGWVIKNCPACLYFNPGNSVCDSPGNVTDCAGQQTTIFPGSSTKSPGSTTKSTRSTGTTTTFTGSTLPTTTPACNRPPRNPNEPQNFTALCMNDTDLLPYNPDCTRFVQCEPGGWVIKNCPACLYFNPGNSVCDSPGNVTDCAGQQTTIFPGSSTKSPGSTTKSTLSTGTTTTFTGSTLPTTTPACNRPPRNPNEPQNFTALCMNDTDLLPYNPDCTRFVQCEPDGWVIKNCPACLYFNPGNSVCDSPGNVTDCAGQQTTIFPGSSTKSPGSTTKSTLSTGTTTTFTGSTLPTTTPACDRPPRNPNEPQNFTALCMNDTDLLPYNPDCTRFVQCEPDGWVIKNCPACLYFNPGNSVCDSPGNVTDCAGQQTTIFPGSSTKSPGSTTKSTLSTGTTTTFTGSTLPTTTPACNRPPRNPNEPQNFTALCMNNADLLPYNPDCTRFVQCEPDGWVIKNCPACLYFNPGNSVCDSPGNVTDCAGQQTTIFTGSSTKATDRTTKFTGSTTPVPTAQTTTGICFAPMVPRNSNETQNFDDVCVNNTLLPYNPDCRQYVQCELTEWKIRMCPDCLYFNKESSVCDYPENVEDCVRPNFTASTSTASITHKPCYAPQRPRNSMEVQNFEEMCFHNRLIPYNPDCRRYVHCEHFYWSLMSCPECLYFNSQSNVCDYPENVPACQDPKTLVPSTTTTTTPASLSATTECVAPTRPRSATEPQDFVTLCRLAGDNAHLPLNTDCGSFVQCTFTSIGIYYIKQCPECQYFHVDSSRCEWPQLVKDCQPGAAVSIPSIPQEAPSTADQCDLDGSHGHARRGFRLVQNFHALCLVDGQVIPVYNDCSCYVKCTGAGVWTVAVCPIGQFYDTDGACAPQAQVTICNSG